MNKLTITLIAVCLLFAGTFRALLKVEIVYDNPAGHWQHAHHDNQLEPSHIAYVWRSTNRIWLVL
jgi:hypothetical protein